MVKKTFADTLLQPMLLFTAKEVLWPNVSSALPAESNVAHEPYSAIHITFTLTTRSPSCKAIRNSVIPKAIQDHMPSLCSVPLSFIWFLIWQTGLVLDSRVGEMPQPKTPFTRGNTRGYINLESYKIKISFYLKSK